VKLLKEVSPNDPPHNEPSKVLDEKLKVDGRVCDICFAEYGVQ